MKWSGFLVAVFFLVGVVVAEGEIWEEDEREVLIRSERGAKNTKGNPNSPARPNGRKHSRGSSSHEPCRYEKGAWSECDPKTNMRTRTLTLKDTKKKDGTAPQPTCEPTKTIQKKCKKACRYEKGTWSPCNAQNEMVRTDTIKEKSDPSCEQKRQTTKKCKNKGPRANKGNKGARRNRQ